MWHTFFFRRLAPIRDPLNLSGRFLTSFFLVLIFLRWSFQHRRLAFLAVIRQIRSFCKFFRWSPLQCGPSSDHVVTHFEPFWVDLLNFLLVMCNSGPLLKVVKYWNLTYFYKLRLYCLLSGWLRFVVWCGRVWVLFLVLLLLHLVPLSKRVPLNSLFLFVINLIRLFCWTIRVEILGLNSFLFCDQNIV